MISADPIFKNFHIQSEFTKCLFDTFRGHENIQTCWGDGIDYQQLKNIQDQGKLLLTNNIILDADEYKNNIHQVNESFYGVMYCPTQEKDRTVVDRDFNCFSNRFDIFRQSWFYHLVRRDWLDRGYVSFNCNITNSVPSARYQGLTGPEIFEKGFKENNHIFIDEHNKIKNSVPYKNFVDSGDLTPCVLASKFSVVLETWFHDNRVITFSEKIMRCLQLPRPWLLFSTQHAVAQLRHWGFDVLDDLVDHSYDLVEDKIQRQLLILDIAENLMMFDVAKNSVRLQQASEHNQSILKNWNSVWFINIEKDFALARSKALVLK